MKRVELTLADWLALYRELCEAERRLAQASPDDEATTQLRADVHRLQGEADAAWNVVNAELSASKARAQ